MKKFIIKAFALLLTVAAIVPTYAKLGYQGENPAKTTIGTSGTSTGRFGHRGENPTTRTKRQQEERQQARKNWQAQHRGTRAYKGSIAQ